MSRRKRERIGAPFIPLLVDTMKSKAWLAMSPYSRILYIALKARYGLDLKNNGRIYLSARMAADETGLNKSTIARGFHELVHYGFIVMTSPGCLGVEGRGKAAHWRLTELGYMHEPPTRDFQRWNGTLFRYQRKQKPVPPERTVCTAGADIPLSRQSGHSHDKLSGQSGHTHTGACPVQADISRLTTRGLRWTAPTIEEVFGEEAELLRAQCEANGAQYQAA